MLRHALSEILRETEIRDPDLAGVSVTVTEIKPSPDMDFGAFVNFFGPRDGLVHISELAAKRVGKVGDVVKEGDMVKVKLIGVDDRGKVRLSMKVVDQQTGEDLEKRKSDGGDQPREATPAAE